MDTCSLPLHPLLLAAFVQRGIKTVARRLDYSKGFHALRRETQRGSSQFQLLAKPILRYNVKGEGKSLLHPTWRYSLHSVGRTRAKQSGTARETREPCWTLDSELPGVPLHMGRTQRVSKQTLSIPPGCRHLSFHLPHRSPNRALGIASLKTVTAG